MPLHISKDPTEVFIKEAKKAIFDADTLTTELADLLIERVMVYPDNRIEIAYKVKDIFE